MNGFLGHTVTNGVLNYGSVSSVKLFDPRTKGGCPRRWWWRYVRGEREPDSDNMKVAKEAGISLDKELKHYLRTGEKNISALALKGLHILEKPGPDIGLDVNIHSVTYFLNGQPFAPLPDLPNGEQAKYPHGIKVVVRSALTAGGIPFVGELDIVHARGHYRDDDGDFYDDPPGTVEVGDIKFKSVAADRYGNSTMMMPTDLVRDIQMAGYGEWVGRIRPETTNVRLSHLYFPKKGALPTKVTKLHVLDDCRRTWEYVNSVVLSMVDVAKETDIERVPGNTESCDAYAGCPRRETCSAYRTNSLDALYGKIAADHVQEKQVGLLASNPQMLQQQPQQTQPTVDIRAQLAQEEAQMRAQAAQQQQQMQQPPAQLAEVCTRLGGYGYGFPSLAGNAAQAYAQMGGQSVVAGFVYQGIPAPPGARRSLHSIQLTEPGHIFQLEGELAAERGTPAPAPAQVQYTPYVPAAPTPQAVVQAPMPLTITHATPGLQLTGGGILPPGAPESMPQLAQAYVPPANVATPPPVAEPYVIGSEPAATPVTEPPKKTRGRPKKESLDAAPEATAAVAAPTPPPSTPVGVPASQVPPVATSSTEQTERPTSWAAGAVLINARAASLSTKSLAPYVDYINADLSRRYSVTSDGKPGIQDVRCVPKDSPLAFGGWKGAVREIVKADPPPDEAYHLDTHMDELNEAVADALRVVAEQRGWLYVRGVR